MDLGWLLNPMTNVFIRGKDKKHTQREEVRVNTGAETGGVTLPQPRTPGATRSWERQGRTFRGTMALLTASFQTPSLQNWEGMHSPCFKPPSSWYFVTAAWKTNTPPHLSYSSSRSNRGPVPSKRNAKTWAWAQRPLPSLGEVGEESGL